MTMSGSDDFEEQERLAELKAWWEDNRWYVIGAIIAGLAAFAGYRGWQYWSASQEADAAFTAMAADVRGDIMLAQGRLDEARSAYKQAVEKAGARNPVKQIAETKLNALGGSQ
jgi:predicted negative regulator of RcsB-dependent stress response